MDGKKSSGRPRISDNERYKLLNIYKPEKISRDRKIGKQCCSKPVDEIEDQER